ncbi:MAG: hypothetical protein R6U32_03615, partial [Candidatus Woesearchaeota archaeon]
MARWIKKENVKWLVLFFILALGLRLFFAFAYEPANCTMDAHNYMNMNFDLLEGRIDMRTRATTFIAAPMMVVISWLGFSALMSTVISLMIISSLILIPLWMIAEHLNISPKLAAVFFIFSTLDIGFTLPNGHLSSEFGMLALAIYFLLILKGYYRTAPFVLFIPFISHKSSPLIMVLLMAFMGVFSLVKHRRMLKKGLKAWLLNEDVRKWLLWSCMVVFVFFLIKFVLMNPNLMSNNQTVFSTNYAEVSRNTVRVRPVEYLDTVGSSLALLVVFGFLEYYRRNKDSIAMQSWLYITQAFAFLPLFTLA